MAKKKITLVEGKDSVQATIEHSKKGSLTWLDAAKGGIMAAGMGGLTILQQLLSNGADELFTPHTGKTVGLAAIGGLVTYLLKNLFTDTKIVKVQDA